MRKLKIWSIYKTITCIIFMGIGFASPFKVLAEPDPIKNALTGWYAGFGAGYQNLSSNGQTYMVQRGPSATDKMHLVGNNVVGEMHLGIGKLLNSFYYGGKLLATISSTKASQTKTTQTTFLNMQDSLKLSKNYGIGLVGHVGGKLGTNNILYGIVGVTYGQFKVNYTEIEDNVSGKQTKKLLGLPLGIGFARAITESIRVFGEGTYTIYQSFLTSDLYTGRSDVTFRSKIAPRELNIIAGISYAF